MIPPKYAPLLFALILSGLMSLLVSGIATLRATGLAPQFTEIWLGAWLTAWLFAFPKRPKPRLVHYLKFHLIPRLRASRFYAPLRRAAANMDVRRNIDSPPGTSCSCP